MSGMGGSGTAACGRRDWRHRHAPPVVARVAPKPTGPVRVSSGTVAGMIISRPEPVYPPIAKAAHVQGAVILHAIISKQGTIENLQVVSGHAMLVTAARWMRLAAGVTSPIC